METSLHRELKARYAVDGAEQEKTLGEYRIDVVLDETLIEIQHGSLSAIRSKIAKLVRKHRVVVVKPLIRIKTLIRLDGKDGEVISTRRSPKKGNWLSLFDELIYFVNVFPHPNLALETPLVDIAEYRVPGHGRRRRWRKEDFIVEDQCLVGQCDSRTYRTAADLFQVLPTDLPRPFHTGHLADAAGINRSLAQRIAYCLRETKAVDVVGKTGNSVLYEINTGRTKRVAPLKRRGSAAATS